jgi:hypothetical protein
MYCGRLSLSRIFAQSLRACTDHSLNKEIGTKNGTAVSAPNIYYSPLFPRRQLGLLRAG